MSNQPKTREIRLLEGNPGKRPMPKAIALKDATSRIPEELTGHAREWFKLVSAELRNAHLLKAVDVPKLAIIAQVYGIMREAQEKLSEEGLVSIGARGSLVASPYESMFRSNAKLYHDMASSFGLSPVDRTRLAIAAGDTKDKDPGEERLKQLLG